MIARASRPGRNADGLAEAVMGRSSVDRKLVETLAGAIGLAAHGALEQPGSGPSEETRLAASAIVAHVRYLLRVHRRQPDSFKRRYQPRLLDAFAWGLAVFIQHRSLGDGTKSAQGAELNTALTELKAHLEAQRVTIPSVARLMERAERTRTRVAPSAAASALRLAITDAASVVARAAADPNPPADVGPTMLAEALADELEHVAASFVGPYLEKYARVTLSVVVTHLAPAINELVRWARTDEVDETPAWTRLFVVENRLRKMARLDPRDHHIGKPQSAEQLVAMLKQPGGGPITSQHGLVMAIAEAIRGDFRERMHAVRDLERSLKEPPPPVKEGLAAMLLTTAVSVAIAGAAGVIAGMVVRRISQRFGPYSDDPELASIVRSFDDLFGIAGEPLVATAGRMTSGQSALVRDGLTEALQQVVVGSVPAKRLVELFFKDRPTDAAWRQRELTAEILRDPRNVFVSLIERGLSELEGRLARRLVELHGVFLTADVSELQAVEALLREAGQHARRVQLVGGIVEWMNFLARWQLGPLDGSLRGAQLTGGSMTLPGAITLDYRVDGERPRSNPLVLNDARVGLDAKLWKAVIDARPAATVDQLPVNRVYRFYLGTPFPGPYDVVIKVMRPAGAGLVLDDYRDQGRRALAAHALDLPFTMALDGAIRHGRTVDHDAGLALARQLEAVPMKELVRSRRALVAEASRLPLAKVRAA